MTSVQKTFFIIGVIFSLAMIFIDQSGVAVTLVNMSKSLHLSVVSENWVINSYLLALVIFVECSLGCAWLIVRYVLLS